MNKRSVLVTGDQGFLGRRLRIALGDHYVHGSDATVARETVWGDCRRLFATSYEYDWVVHCAYNLDECLSMDEALFNWARRTRPERVVYISDCRVYPTHLCDDRHKGYGLNEQDVNPAWPCVPDGPVGVRKVMGETLAREAQEDGVNVTIVRPFSVYADEGGCRPFTAFIGQALRNEDPFLIWGDGEQTRDYIHVDDVVNGIVATLDYGIDGPVNFGWGEAISHGELVTLISEVLGVHVNIQYEHDKEVGVRHRVANADVMRRFYAPRISIEEGIARALYHPTFKALESLSVG